jgi:hypothetical protein
MLEKDMDSEESAIFDEASVAASDADHQGDDYPRTIGSAIQLLEAKLQRPVLSSKNHLPTRKKNSKPNPRKNQRKCPYLVNFFFSQL